MAGAGAQEQGGRVDGDPGAGDPLPGSSKQSLGLLAKRKGVVGQKIPGKVPVSAGASCCQGSRAAWGSPAPAAPAGEGVRPAVAWGLRGAESLGHQEEAGMDTSVLQIRHERQGMETSSVHSLLGQEAVLSPSYRISFVPNHLQETALTHILQV